MFDQDFLIQTFYENITEQECTLMAKRACQRLGISREQVVFMAVNGIHLPNDIIIQEIKNTYGEATWIAHLNNIARLN